MSEDEILDQALEIVSVTWPAPEGKTMREYLDICHKNLEWVPDTDPNRGVYDKARTFISYVAAAAEGIRTRERKKHEQLDFANLVADLVVQKLENFSKQK